METIEEVWKGVSRDRGIPEVTARWVSNNLGRVRVVDVREPAELSSALGKIEGVENVPLGTLGPVCTEWDREDAIVVVCRSGGRSGRAALLLENHGFRRVASMDGGMLEWSVLGLPTE